MRNKKAIWILLPLVIGLWGTIIYKVFTHYNPPDAEVAQTIQPKVSIEPQGPSDTLFLHLDYPDPFMKKVSSRPTKSKTASVKQTVKPKPPKKKQDRAVPKPKFRWMGKVANRDNNTSRYLVSVNGNDQIVSVGDSLAGFQFKRAFDDSLEFRKAREVIFVKR